MHIQDLLEATSTEIYDSEAEIVEKMQNLAAQARTEKKVLGTRRYVKVWKSARLWQFDVVIYGDSQKRRMDLTQLYAGDDDEVATALKARRAASMNAKTASKYQKAAHKFLELVKNNPYGWDFVGWDYEYSGTPVKGRLEKIENTPATAIQQGKSMRLFFKLDKE